VIAAIESAAETPTMGRVNSSSGIETNLIDVFNLVKEIIKSDISPNILAPGYGEIRRSALRNSQAKQILGWEPTTSFQEGIRKALKEEMGS
jgi:nucleoside-diphosphate-sugar epimerase